MRVLVCGGRDYTERSVLYGVLHDLLAQYGLITIIEGGATGADRMARDWARSHHQGVVTVEADWKQFGNAAGPIRNARMISETRPDLVVAFPGANGLKKGTGDMVRKARAAGVKVKIIGQEGLFE